MVFALTSLTACGADDDEVAADPGNEPSASAVPTSDGAMPSESATPSEKPAKSKKPLCDDVWVDGAKLPGGYQDCYDADGKRIKADGRYCEFGKPLVTYQSNFWAVPGGPIFEVETDLLDDKQYRKSLELCSA